MTRLKTSDSNSDSKKDGVRIAWFGGKHPLKSGGREQRAIIEMICDQDKTGTEGEYNPEDDKYEPGTPETEDVKNEGAARLGRAEGAGEEDDGKEHQLLNLGKNDTALIFDSYGPMADNGNIDVLRLTWRTKFACEGAAEDGAGRSNEHWGFFTWMVILWVSLPRPRPWLADSMLTMVYSVFLATASYLIFGSWLNYNRYGARGWDLLPHGDTIRDIPYLLKDWTRRVLNTVQGTGSRGGYSAV